MEDVMTNKMTIELDKRYTSHKEATQYVVDYMTQQGKSCVVKSEGSVSVLEINGQEYTMRLSQRILGPVPPQTAILEKVKG